MYKTFLSLLFSFFLFQVQAQNSCGQGSMDPHWMARYEQNLRKMKEGRPERTGQMILPIAFHLSQNSNGTGQTSLRRCLEVVCTTKQLMDSAGFDLYLLEEGLNEVVDNGIFSQHHLASNQQKMRNLRIDSAINVFVVNDAGSGSTGSVSGYYDIQDDWIVVSRKVIKGGEATLAHEIGHFLSLVHPHLGWDGQSWNSSITGPNASFFAPDGQTPTEKVDGSNCATAGDKLCDTPADYNLGLYWKQSCEYVGDARDSDAVLLDPDESLIMSYFSDECRNRFSPQQIALMQADYTSSQRAFLHISPSSGLDSLYLSAEPLMPFGDIYPIQDSLLFEWQSSPGASHYILEVDRTDEFDLDPKSYLLQDTSIILANSWILDRNYYWRVYAFNASNSCLPPSTTQTFVMRSGTSNQHIHSASFIHRLYQQENHLRIEFLRPISSSTPMELLNLEGKLLMRVDIPAQSQKLSIDLSGIPKGIFILRFPEQLFSQKVILN
jgi:hypothetical protein